MSQSDIPSSAVALKYNPQKDSAPVVVASGHGKTAEKIISIADDNGIPVYRDDSASALLTMLDIGKPVPPELFKLIAAIYAEVVRTSDELKNKNYI